MPESQETDAQKWREQAVSALGELAALDDNKAGAAIAREAMALFEADDDDPGPSRTFLNALKSRLKGTVEPEVFEEAVRKARASAGGKHSSRKRKRQATSTQGFESDPRPALSKADGAVNYVEGGGDLNAGTSCGKCRFFLMNSCRLVEGTIEPDDICDLYREGIDFAFKDADLVAIAASTSSANGPDRGEYGVMLSLTEIEDGWFDYLPAPGRFESPVYGTIEITPERNRRFVENFRSAVYQERIPVDAEHETKLSGAVGWITDMRQNSDGSVDAKIEWTDRGKTLMEGDRFKFFSPEFFDRWTDPATGETYSDVAIGGAITTRPFFKEKALRPLVASEAGIDAGAGRVFQRKQEASMTTEKTETKGFFARFAEVFSTDDQKVTEEELREGLLGELGVEPVEAGEGKKKGEMPFKKKKAEEEDDDETAAGEGKRKKATESEGDPEIQIPAAFTERIEAAEKRATKAEERAERLENEARTRRFAEIVTGADAPENHRWFGDVDKNVKMLNELAEQSGEESELFKSFVESQRAQAAQIAFATTLKLKERGHGGTGEHATGSAGAEVAAKAKKLMTEHPEKYPTPEQARVAVRDLEPELAEKEFRENQVL